MKFFRSIFSKQEAEIVTSGVEWVQLTTDEQLSILDDTSYMHPQLIFKHSTQCGISGVVLRSFSSKTGHPESGYNYFVLDLIAFRELSNAIAEKYGVMHQSPQVLIVKNGIVVAHASHHAILELDLNEFV
ncbi:MAG: bacillithiol system redox-active protein YtxJ [Flavobacteriaceae bacterium]|nr:bacillithiol system redox-active protein YtxJ [Flavobacteriaceae bacterium]